MRMSDIIPASLGIAVGLLIAWTWMSITASELDNLDASRGVEGSIYELVK